MNKMEYQKPWAEFVQFSNEDVITASAVTPDDGCKEAAQENGCIFSGWQQQCDWLFKAAPGKICRATQAAVDCGVSSENGEWNDGCSLGYTNWYSEP